MLKITVPATEQYDESKNEFIYSEATTLRLEHSLVSISKWESKHHKPFLSQDRKTLDETIDYIQCMSLDDVPEEVFRCMSRENLKAIEEYIQDPMTATRIKKQNHGNPTGEITTSELIYYWMIELGIPVEFETWHLNRLLTLIRVCNVKNAPSKKMGKGDALRQNAALNAARRKR